MLSYSPGQTRYFFIYFLSWSVDLNLIEPWNSYFAGQIKFSLVLFSCGTYVDGKHSSNCCQAGIISAEQSGRNVGCSLPILSLSSCNNSRTCQKNGQTTVAVSTFVHTDSVRFKLVGFAAICWLK